MSTPEVKKPFLSTHAQEGFLGTEKGADPHPIMCGHILIGLCGGIHLRKKLHMHLGEDPRTSQVWRKKEVNWPYVNKVRVGL